jgi:hypothetical protein
MAGKFEPKVPVKLNPPKDDPISVTDLAKADGEEKPFVLRGWVSRVLEERDLKCSLTLRQAPMRNRLRLSQ